MKKTLAVAVAATALVAAQAQAQDFRAAAERDLRAAHDLLRDNHPAANVDKDSAAFRAWLDKGLEESLAGIGRVQGQLGYENAMRGYLTGFRDTNISFSPGVTELPGYFAAFWPGFSTRWTANGGYTVAWSRPGNDKLPPVGAKLISCDKKPADQVAKERLDRYEGDLTQAADRARTAPYLFWDRGNPYTAYLPNKCVFETAGKKKTYTLDYQPSPEAERKTAYYAALGKPQGGPTMEQWNGGYWLRLPTFAEGPEWDAFVTQLDGQLAALQAAPFIVLDMRGADDAPTSRNGYRLANRLWGPDYILANQPQVGNAAYKVSPLNRAVYADAVARMKQDPLSYYQVPIWEKMLAEFDAALAAGQPLLQRNESKAPGGAAPAAKLTGKVIVVTDAYCSNQCLSLMDLFTRLPNVTHAGTPTSGDSIFVGETVAQLPSGQGSISFGNKAWLDRPRPSGQGYTPTAAFTGDPADETAVRAFVQTLTQ